VEPWSSPRLVDIGDDLAAGSTDYLYQLFSGFVAEAAGQHRFAVGRLAGRTQRRDIDIGRINVQSIVEHVQHHACTTHVRERRRHNSHSHPHAPPTAEVDLDRAPSRVAFPLLET
jgi:hypothetical protein